MNTAQEEGELRTSKKRFCGRNVDESLKYSWRKMETAARGIDKLKQVSAVLESSFIEGI